MYYYWQFITLVLFSGRVPSINNKMLISLAPSLLCTALSIATGMKLLENHKALETLLFSSSLPRNPHLETKLWLIISRKWLSPST